MITIKENNLNLCALSNWDIKGRTVVQLEYTDANVSVYNKIFDNGTEIVLYPEEGKERAAYGVFYNTDPKNSNSKYIYVDTFESVAMAAKYVNDVLLDKLGLVEKIETSYKNKKLRINESKYDLGGRNYSNLNPVLQEYIDFLQDDGINILNVAYKLKTIYVKQKDLDMASFYLQDRDYFGKDLYKDGWTVATNI